MVGQIAKLASDLEVDGLLGLHRDLISRLGVPADIGAVLVQREGAETANLDSVALREGISHGAEDALNNLFRPLLGDAGAFCDLLDEFALRHDFMPLWMQR